MQKLSRKDQFFVGVTLFSMFFGAGNLIFPPFLGLTAGSSAVPAFIGFAASAEGLPILGVIAVTRVGSIEDLAGRVCRPFAAVFILLPYLAIGPGLAIPRTASVSFEMAVPPFVGADAPLGLLQVGYTVVFFAVALSLALRPSQLVDWLGKRLAPTLLILIGLLFVGCLMHPGIPSVEVAEIYRGAPLVQGFLDGYQTMDAIVALIFGMVLTMNIQAKGITEESAVVKVILKASVLAAALFLTVYGALAFVGHTHGAAGASNGAQLLSGVAHALFGTLGGLILAGIFIIACLNTCISLTCCCANYFHSLFPRFSYNAWACFFALVSAVVANAGLDTILTISVPILNCLYPAAITLIAQAFLPAKLRDKPLLFPLAVGMASVFGVACALDQAGFTVPGLTRMADFLPLYEAGLGWLAPTVIAAVLGLVIRTEE